jgi:hypothetical protein
MATARQKKRPKRQSQDIAFRKASKTRRQLGRQLNCRPNSSGNISSPPEPRPQNLPLWAPDGVDLDFVPPEVQRAVAELVQPLYDQFVIGAADGLEKSLGVTITHLLWLEILEQFDIKREYTQVDAVLGLAGNRHEMIDRHLRLIDSKVRVGYFLVRIRDLRKRLTEQTQILQPVLNENSDNASTGLILDSPNNREYHPQMTQLNTDKIT